MNVSDAIGQPNLLSYDPFDFQQGGFAFGTDLAFDPSGNLWLNHNIGLVSVYAPPFRTGQRRTYWFDYRRGVVRPELPPFPSGFSQRPLNLTMDDQGQLWFTRGGFARLQPPIVAASGARGVAGIEAKMISPGQILTLYGINLGSTLGVAGEPNPDYPVTLGQSVVRVNGRAAPLFFARNDQLNFQIPYEVSLQSDARIEISNAGLVGPPIIRPVARSAPEMFSLVLNEFGQSGPIRRGSTGTVFASGLGQVAPPSGSGKPAPTSEPLARTVSEVATYLNGRQCEVLYAGLAPGWVGVYQVNFIVPADLPMASLYWLQLLQNSIPSNAVAVQIQ